MKSMTYSKVSDIDGAEIFSLRKVLLSSFSPYDALKSVLLYKFDGNPGQSCVKMIIYAFQSHILSFPVSLCSCDMEKSAENSN